MIIYHHFLSNMNIEHGQWTMYALTVDNRSSQRKYVRNEQIKPRKKIKQSFWQNSKSKQKFSATIFGVFFTVRSDFVVLAEYAEWKLRLLIFKSWSKVSPNYIVRSLAPLHICIEHWQFKRESFFTKIRERERIIEFDAINFVHMHTTQFFLSEHNNEEKYVHTVAALTTFKSNSQQWNP